MTDIDIDFADRKQALDVIQHVSAVLTEKRQAHNSGVYFQDIPRDPLDDMAVWDYSTAEQKGYFKIDFLNNSSYRGVRNEEHLVQLLLTEPPWDKFDDPETVAKLAHIHDHFHIVHKIRPRSIEDLAVCIALIRPPKRYLINKPRAEIDRGIWSKTTDGKFQFKKSHAIAYAASIVVQLNLLVEND